MTHVEINTKTGTAHFVMHGQHFDIPDTIRKKILSMVEGTGVFQTDDPLVIDMLFNHYFGQLSPEHQRFFAPSRNNPELFIATSMAVWSEELLDIHDGWHKALHDAIRGNLSSKDAGMRLIKIAARISLNTMPPQLQLTSAMDDQLADIANVDFFAPTLNSPASMSQFIDLHMRLETLQLKKTHILAFKALNFHDPIFHDKDVDLYVLKATMDGAISSDQAAMLLLYSECQMNPKCEIQTLLIEDGVINDEAFELMSSHLNFPKPDGSTARILDANARDSLKASLENLTRNEAQFFILPSRLVLPPHLLNLVMQACFKGDAYQIRSVVGGPSPFERYFTSGARDVLIPCRHLLTPKTLHHSPTDPLGIYLHDVHHVLIASAHPQKLRQLFISILEETHTTLATQEQVLNFSDTSYLTKQLLHEKPNQMRIFTHELLELFENNHESASELAHALVHHQAELKSATGNQVSVNKLLKEQESSTWQKDLHRFIENDLRKAA